MDLLKFLQSLLSPGKPQESPHPTVPLPSSSQATSELQVSPACLALIKASEGCRLEAYGDATGIQTIGYGHTGPEVRVGLVWTQVQADDALAEDAEEAAQAVRTLVSVKLTQGQFDALTDFVFNLGRGALAGSTLLKLLNAGDYAGAAAQFGEWVHAGKEVLPGLVKRRAAERDMFIGA